MSENTVATLMHEQHLGGQAQEAPAFHATGQGALAGPGPGEADFPAQQINRKWFGDGTEISTGEGRLHLVSVLDVASCRVLGFALGERHDAQLAYGAMAMAVRKQDPHYKSLHGSRGTP